MKVHKIGDEIYSYNFFTGSIYKDIIIGIKFIDDDISYLTEDEEWVSADYGFSSIPALKKYIKKYLKDVYIRNLKNFSDALAEYGEIK